MAKKWKEGYEVVYAVRAEREGESWFKLWTASLFYRLIYRITDVKIPLDTGDFRLMDRKVVNVLKQMRERHRFPRGMSAWVGFKQVGVEYKRAARVAGETKYPFRKMFRLAINADHQLFLFPLQVATFFGFASAGIAILAIPVVVAICVLPALRLLWSGHHLDCVLFLGGVQLISLGILGEYIGVCTMKPRAGRCILCVKHRKTSNKIVAQQIVSRLKTQLAVLFSFCLLLLHPSSLSPMSLSFLRDREFFRSMLAIALPVAFQQLITASLNMIDVLMVGQLGETSVAALGLANQIFFLLILFLFGVTSGMSIFTAQYWGKGDVENIRKVLGICLVIAVSVAAAFTLAATLIPQQLMSFYTEDQEVIKLGSDYLRIVGLSYVMTAISVSYISVLRSITMVKMTVVVSVLALGSENHPRLSS